MRILGHQTFDKHFRKRILPHPKLVTRFDERVTLFMENPQHPIIKNHTLTVSHRGLRAFSVTGDIRVIYERIDEDTVRFLRSLPKPSRAGS